MCRAVSHCGRLRGVARGVWVAGGCWPPVTAGDVSATGEGLEKTACSRAPGKGQNLPPARSAVPAPG